jgi:hypothetical protein
VEHVTQSSRALPELAHIEARVLQHINHHRVARGLPSFATHESLSQQAQQHSRAMASRIIGVGHRGFVERTRIIRKTLPCAAIAENVGFIQGHDDVAERIVQEWLSSTSHRKNIEGNFTVTGLAVVKSDIGGYYLTQLFCRLRKDFFTYQIGALDAFVTAAGLELQHVKMHGALLAMALEEPDLTLAMCEATLEADQNLIWVTLSGQPTVEPARNLGLKVVQEFYADRAYTADKMLASRKRPGAVLKDLSEIGDRLRRLLETGELESIDGQQVAMEFDSICVHGDSPGALEIVRTVRNILAEYGIAIAPMKRLT